VAKTCAGVVLASLLCGAAPALAKEPVHVLRPGETVESVARHYYGAGWKASYLIGRNRLSWTQPPKPGTALVLPSCWVYKLRRGDTIAKITKRYLGPNERFEVLLRANNLKKTQNLTVGQELLLPFHIAYVVEKNDTLLGLAKRFYQSTRKASFIKDYNEGRSVFKPGDKLTIPIFDRSAIAVYEKGPPPLPKPGAKVTEPEEKPEPGDAADDEPDDKPEPADKPAAAQEPPEDMHWEEALETALNAYSEGDFVLANDNLEDMLDNFELPPQALGKVLSHLGFCAVAFNKQDAARDFFRQWLAVEPTAKLDPVQTSPKILTIFNEVAAENTAGPGGG
jgi:LysM repeat protein